MSNITTKYFSKVISQSLENTAANDVFYFAFGRFRPWQDENTPDTAIETTQKINEFKRDMIAGKRVKHTDTISLIKRHFWFTGTVYAQYDDTDSGLFDKSFYVINGSERVYKCLYNNGGAASTSEPTLVQNEPFQTADGYIWKYMYSVSSANNSKFSTGLYIPVEPNTSVSSAATNGSIDVVFLTNPGVGYTGYATGFIKEVISNTLFSIESSTASLSVDNFYYNTSALYIYNGTGEGQLTNISNYIVNSSGHYIYTEDPLNSPMLDITSEFRIAPQIKISGDGTGAKAICTVNTTSYGIETISVVSSGSNYSYANVSIVSNPSYGSNAAARAVVPPYGGHGHDAVSELGTKHVGFSVFFNGSESGTIPTEVSFRQAGLIWAPQKFTKPANTYIAFNANTDVSNTEDSIAVTNADSFFAYGDRVKYSIDAGNTALSALISNEYYYVSSVNSTAIKLSHTLDGASIDLTSGLSESGHYIYTSNTFSSNTFDALTTLTITTVLNTFTANEIILGQDSGATAYVGFANATVAKVAMIQGDFTANGTYGETISGQTSGVTATIDPDGINNPDIERMNFRVMHIDNIEYIQRSSADNEQGYLILTI